jgi:hypothetical protein
MPTVPTDPRPQFSFADLAVASLGLGRMPPTEQVGPDRYIITGYWPRTPTRNSFPSSGRTVVEPPQPEAPRSSAAARAVWPNLR